MTFSIANLPMFINAFESQLPPRTFAAGVAVILMKTMLIDVDWAGI